MSQETRPLPNHPKTFCEFFAGIGLVAEGLRDSGWRCVYANDIDLKKQEMHEARFGRQPHFHLGDIRDTEAVISGIPDRPFLATASFPCVDLSLAGHWRGFAGSQSSTFFAFAQALKRLGERKPPLIMLENVMGFLASRDGADFAQVAAILADLGYWLDAFILDAAYFVPQSRPRVFLIGWLHPSNRLASSKAFEGTSPLRPAKLLRLMRSIALPTGWIAFPLAELRIERRLLSELIDFGDDQAWWSDTAVAKHYAMLSLAHRDAIDLRLVGNSIDLGMGYRRKRNGGTRLEVRFDGLAGCLRTPRGGSARQIVVVTNRGELRMRWMSPREYARLQGADDFPLMKRTNQNLFGFGDAVCVPVIRWIDQQVLTPVFESSSSPS